MKRITLFSMFCLVLISSAPASGVINMTFEGMSDGQLVGTYYSGVSYVAGASGTDWIATDVTTGTYNASSWPSGQSWGSGEYWMYDYVSTWTGVSGSDGLIYFDNADATYVEVGYAAYTALNLDAYDIGGTLIDTDSGPANLRYMHSNPSGPGTLRVDWDGINHIAYVHLYDLGNYWTADNIRTDATGIGVVPAPGAIILGGIGVGLVGWLRRRKTL